MAPLGPYKLVTVNNAPERAKRLIGRVVEDVKDKYTIIHAGNADGMFFFFLSQRSKHLLTASRHRQGRRSGNRGQAGPAGEPCTLRGRFP